jgi:hypothetical protein
MGVFRFQEISDWQQAAMKERNFLLRNPDDAGPIGRRAQSPIQHTATWITIDPKSFKLLYGKEKSIEVYRGHERLLPEDLQRKMGMRQIRGWMFQVRKEVPKSGSDSFDLFAGKEVMLSKLPHSRNYFVRRRLQACKHEKAVWRQVARDWDRHAEQAFAEERLEEVLEELAVTPFVSFKDCLAAWAVAPKRFDVLGKERFDTSDDYTLAVLDVPFEDAYQLLWTDPAIQETLAATLNGTLFMGYQTAQDVRGAIRTGFRPRRAPVRPPVTDELRERREALMEASCWAALCGREVPDAGDSVAESAVLIYHRFALNFVHRQRISRASRCPPKAEPVDRSPAMTREFTAQWREIGFDDAAKRLTRIIDHVLQAEEAEVNQCFVGTLRPPLAGWPVGWERPDGLDQALRRLKAGK